MEPTAVFLTTDNLNYISSLLFRFFSDTYQVRLTDLIRKDAFMKLMGDTMIAIYKEKKTAPLSELNQLTLQKIKDHIKQTYIAPPKPQVIPEPMNPSPPHLSEDSDFFNKVQQLELQRKTFQVPMAPVPPVITPTIPNTPPPSLSTVYMPMPPKIGKEILIHSMNRDWQRFMDHSHFEWNGPLHHTSDSLTRVIGLIGHFKETAISLNIQGAGGEIEKVTLILTSNMYQPVVSSLGYIKRLSLPWKISLKTIYGTPLHFGKAIRYTCESKNRIQLTDSHSFKEGDWVLVCMDNKSFKISKVVSMDSSSIKINEDILMDGYVLKEKEHYSILLETTTSEHRPITKS